jgi:hypothetical protein
MPSPQPALVHHDADRTDAQQSRPSDILSFGRRLQLRARRRLAHPISGFGSMSRHINGRIPCLALARQLQSASQAAGPALRGLAGASAVSLPAGATPSILWAGSPDIHRPSHVRRATAHADPA